MVSMFTSVCSESAPMVSRGFVFIVSCYPFVPQDFSSEPSDDLYSMLDQFAVAGLGVTWHRAAHCRATEARLAETPGCSPCRCRPGELGWFLPCPPAKDEH